MSKEKRSGTDRRSPADGRRLLVPAAPWYTGHERRKFEDRRVRPERRKEWERISEWSSRKESELDGKEEETEK